MKTWQVPYLPLKIYALGTQEAVLLKAAARPYECNTDFDKEDKQVSPNNVDVQEIENKVIEIISEQMGVDKAEITRETSFINDLNADSLDTVELVMEFEDEFDMSIPDEQAEKIQTVGAAIDYIVNAIHSKNKE